MVKIAHLILTLTDPIHNARLIRRLCDFSDVYIHIDINIDINLFKNEIKNLNNCYFINTRYHCEWGGWNAVVTEIQLLKYGVLGYNY